MSLMSIVNRNKSLFELDIAKNEKLLREQICNSKILVIGAAGSIGQSVTIELFKYSPKVLHAVDISENNLVELVRIIRSTIGYNSCDFKTFAIDCGGAEFKALCNAGEKYDYIYNLSALKHVRSEKDPFTLMRLINVNIQNSIKLMELADLHMSKNYFCVSTDKAANPVNMMGASKRIMEKFLFNDENKSNVTMARFANVAFSDGSLLHGFMQRFAKRQPISAPNDVQRYFVSDTEAGQLCIMSSILGEKRDIFFPKLDEKLHLEYFSDIALRFVEYYGYEPVLCSSEEEARYKCSELIADRKWPLFLFKSDTTGEKPYEEFFTEKETVDMKSFQDVGVVKNNAYTDNESLRLFQIKLNELQQNNLWNKNELIELFGMLLPNFVHLELGKSLDDKM